MWRQFFRRRDFVTRSYSLNEFDGFREIGNERALPVPSRYFAYFFSPYFLPIPESNYNRRFRLKIFRTRNRSICYESNSKDNYTSVINLKLLLSFLYITDT